MIAGIDATARLHGGGALHLKRLLEYWGGRQEGPDKLFVFTREENVEALKEHAGPSTEILPVLPSGCSTGKRLFWQQVLLPGIAARKQIDVLLCPRDDFSSGKD